MSSVHASISAFDTRSWFYWNGYGENKTGDSKMTAKHASISTKTFSK